jgi:hypothetical protein
LAPLAVPICTRAAIHLIGRGQTGGWSKEVLGDLVNQAYGPTPSEAGLMWKTAPPGVPIPPPGSGTAVPTEKTATKPFICRWRRIGR